MTALRIPSISLERGFFIGVSRYLISLPIRIRPLANYVADHEVDIFNFHYPSLTVLSVIILRWLGRFSGLIVLSYHGEDISRLGSACLAERLLWRIIFRHVDHVVTCSRSLETTISGLLAPSDCVKLSSIPNGIDLERFELELNDAVPSPIVSQPYIMTIAAFVPKKGYDTLLKAFHFLRMRHPDLMLLCIGQSGSILPEIRKLIEDLDLTGRVVISVDHPHAEIAWYLRHAELFVLASRAEPFGLVNLEAGLSRCPVVATNVGGIPEIIQTGVHGVLVPPDNPAALTTAIEQLMAQPEEAALAGQRLYERVRTEFSSERFYTRYARVFTLDSQDDRSGPAC